MIFRHFKKYIFRGILSIIPIALTVFALMLLYSAVDRRVVQIIEKYFGFSFPGLGIIFVCMFLYLLGLLTSNVIGRQGFRLIDKITSKIPIVRTTYKVGKKLGETLSLPEKQVFKKVVLVEFLRPGMWTIGFVTGSVIDHKNNHERLLKVYVPTPPNPTSGTMILVKEDEIRDPGWTIEEALNSIISGGIIGPEELR